MAKKQKTRKQKILSDQRKQANPLPEIDTSSGKIIINTSTLSTAQTHTATNPFTYSHLKLDLTKTALVTIAIIVLELLLHFFSNSV